MNGPLDPRADRISIQRYVVENSYITQYLSRIVKDNALSVYYVLRDLVDRGASIVFDYTAWSQNQPCERQRVTLCYLYRSGSRFGRRNRGKTESSPLLIAGHD